MQQLKLSIIITCYNLGEYLEEAVNSIQEFIKSDDYEIILINDGSTDSHTIEIINYIEKVYPDIIVVNQLNTGLGKARNNGIKLAKGKFIIPLDADNKLRPEFIYKTIEILENRSDVAVVYGDASFFGKRTGLWKGKVFDLKQMVLNNYIDACAGFRKAVWEELNGYDEKMPVMGFEDWDFWLRIANRGHKFEYVKQVFFDYRVRDNSMLSDAWQKREILLDYIFNKKELLSLKALRLCLIENEKLKEEPAMNQILNIILNKVKRKLSYLK